MISLEGSTVVVHFSVAKDRLMTSLPRLLRMLTCKYIPWQYEKEFLLSLAVMYCVASMCQLWLLSKITITIAIIA